MARLRQGSSPARPVVLPPPRLTAATTLSPLRRRADDRTMRYESSITSVSWIPSEAVVGGTRVAFDAGFTHYDQPPPEIIEDLAALRDADRFRFANELRAWI